MTSCDMQMTSKTKKAELPVIAGCLQGLACLLVNFTQSAEEGTENDVENVSKLCCVVCIHNIIIIFMKTLTLSTRLFISIARVVT